MQQKVKMKDEKKIDNERCKAKQERAEMEEGIKVEQCDIIGKGIRKSENLEGKAGLRVM